MRKSSKEKYVNQPRRQSARLRSSSALCEEEDAKHIHLCCQQHDSVNNYIVKQLKFEVQESEGVDPYKPGEQVNSVSDSGSDDLTINDITLKDLQQKCKSKKRKDLKSTASSLSHSSHSDSDQSPDHHDRVKVKEVESDLEEPLIILKRKITKTTTRQRKNRKHTHVDPLLAEHEDSFLFTHPECGLKESFQSITTETASAYHELSEHGALVLELEDVQEQSLKETVHSVVCSMATKKTLSSDIPELSYNIKSEIVDAYPLKQHAKDDCSVGISSEIISDSKLVGNSSPEHIQEVSNDWPERQQKPFISLYRSDHCLSTMKEASIFSVSELENDVLIDGHFTNTVKSELSDKTWPQEYASPNVDTAQDFMAKPCHSDDSTTNLCPRADADHQDNQEVSSSCSTTPFYSVYDNFIDHEELNESLPVIDVDAVEIKKIALAMSKESQQVTSTNCTFHHNSVSAAVTYPDADKHGNNKNHDILLGRSIRERTITGIESQGDSSYKRMASEPSCALSMITGGFHDSTDMTVQGVAISSQGGKRDSTCNLPCEKLYGLEEIFLSSKDKLIDAEEMVTCCSNEFSNFTDSMTLREKSEAQPPVVLSNCIPVPIDEQCPGRNLVKVTEEKDSCHFPEEQLKNTLDQLACNEKLYVVNSLGKIQVERDENFMECLSPKKLLSNRQTISPSSQEKLCWALNDIYTQNSSQITSQSEAGYLISPKKLNKKRRNDNEGPLSPVKKVNLKSLSCHCSKSSSFTMHMEKAIVFSQRQMHDIEKLATQLLNGLSLMRNIVEETLITDVPSNFTPDEIRAANENALELERTTKKWLTIMTKDCTRFCKIMKVADNKSAVPVSAACKQKRKITFADEVGGVLCQVKVFERQQSPVITHDIQQASSMECAAYSA